MSADHRTEILVLVLLAIVSLGIPLLLIAVGVRLISGERRPRLQYSLRAMLLIMTIVAALTMAYLIGYQTGQLDAAKGVLR